MNKYGATTIRGPRSDDRILMDIENAVLGYMSIYVAHKLKLFSLLDEAPRTLAEVCLSLNLARRPAEALLRVGLALGLVQKKDEHYALTAMAEDYFLEASPFYWGHALDLDMSMYPSLDSLENMFLSDAHQMYGGGDWVKTHEENPEQARMFTNAMHSYSMGPALAWPEKIDLSKHQQMLDIGAGSGAHSIGAVLKWQNLQVTAFDIAPVCDITQEYVSRYGLQSRIRTHIGDMWHDPFPEADMHFYSMIYHDWPLEKNRFLTKKSFESLKPGGRIIIHEMLYDDDMTGPFTVAAYNIGMLWCTEGEQYSGSELTAMLHEAGFTDIIVKRTFGYWGIVTGCKECNGE